MSPASRLKRALVTLLLHFARIYKVVVDVKRESPDASVRTAFRKVMLKAHPDKAGGCADATQKLNSAYGSWQDATKNCGKAGRPSSTAPETKGQAVVIMTNPSVKRKEYRINSEAVVGTAP